MEGDTKALAERHAVEHAESLNVPAKKMGIDVITAPSVRLHERVSSRIMGVTAKVDEKLFGIGGAPIRATTFPATPEGRKSHPVATGVLDYFPDAIVALSHVSWTGNEQHNPGQPLHWAREKSADEWDAMMRHFMERGTLDGDGIRHSAKVAWRALAALQKEIEGEK